MFYIFYSSVPVSKSSEIAHKNVIKNMITYLDGYLLDQLWCRDFEKTIKILESIPHLLELNLMYLNSSQLN